MKKYLIILSTLILLILSLGVIDILSPSFSILGRDSKIIPHNVKNFLKEKVFFIPAKLQKADLLEIKLKIKEDMYLDAKESNIFIYNNLIELIDDQKLTLFDKRQIKSKKNIDYELSVFKIPLLEYYVFEDKPIAYLEAYNNNLITATGDGFFFRSTIDNNKIDIKNFKKIKSNIHSFKEYSDIRNPGWLSIKDIKFYENDIFLSITEEVKKNCFNLSILRSDINDLKEFEFKKIYNMEQCTSSDVNEFLGWQSGGRIEFYKGHILLTVGDFRNRSHPQNDKSLFGKLLAINLETNETLIISKGHRNQQGLLVDGNIIVSTEHGPAGGDEINIHRNVFNQMKIPNYGWPEASYGVHYQKVLNLNNVKGTYEDLIKIAPLKKSHKENGFIEPIKYFAPGSVAASEIEKSNKVFDKNFTNDFYFGVLRNNLKYRGRLYHFKFDNKFEQIIFEDEIILKERIRDIVIPKNSENMYLLLESIPAIGVVKLLK